MKSVYLSQQYVEDETLQYNNGGAHLIPEKVPQFSTDLMMEECLVRQQRFATLLDEKILLKRKRSEERLLHSKKGCNSETHLMHDGWELMASEKTLTLYRRDAVPGSLTMFDTFKVRTMVEGVSAMELCHFFWDVHTRSDWEVSIDSPPTVLSTPDDHSVVLHQSFKTIWPVHQRYSVFWSRLIPLPILDPERCLSRYCVINCSTNYPLHDSTLRKYTQDMIFVLLDVILLCETRWKGDASTRPPRRDEVVTQVGYVCSVDPGGWAPVSLARVTAKKEYPRVMHRLMDGCKEKFKNTSLQL